MRAPHRLGDPGEAARKAFQMLPQNYQFQGPSYLKGRSEGRSEGRAEGRSEGRAEGRSEGRAEGKADSVLEVLDARGIVVTQEQRRRILECSDLERLGAWLRRAATVADASGLFGS